MADLQNLSGGGLPGPVREQDKIMLVLAYLGPLALIPLLTVKDSEFVTFHARQGLAFMVFSIAYGIAMGVIAMIPVIGWIVGCLGSIASFGFLVFAIFLIVKAVGGERYRVPLIGDIADRLPQF